eukprot:TRINITY_DN504_c0_g1_i1.p1 TRINITY_DN504_c0_g1~~TRINITY_DN504_c0_g1_i1.p1  ORF type:complete len:630 (-),score=142.86 TRINITY_DN504_c0_g1_i1:470-2359(-)
MYSLPNFQAKTQQLLAPGAPVLLMPNAAQTHSKPWELAIKCSATNNLLRNVPFALTITNFWQLYPRDREYNVLTFPKELCQEVVEEEKTTKDSDRTVDLTNALNATFEVAIPQPNGTLKFLDQSQLPSVFALRKHNPWTKLKKGSPISLRLYFYRLPSDFELDAESSPAPKPKEFHFFIKFNERPSKEGYVKCFAKSSIVFHTKPRVKKTASASPSPNLVRASISVPNLVDSPRSLKRSQDSLDSSKVKKVRSTSSLISSWSEFFLNMGVTDMNDISNYVNIVEEQRIVDWNQLARIPIETLQHLGFKLADIAKIRMNYNRGALEDSSEGFEREKNMLRSSSSSIETGSSQDSGSEYSNDEEEIALQLLLLNSSYSASPPPSPPAYNPVSPSTSLTTVNTPMVTLPSIAAIPQPIASSLSVNRVVHLTIKLGKLIICEVKDPSVDLKARLALADEVESLLVQWLHTVYPTQKLMTLDEVRELTEQPAPPYDPSLAYYIKVFSAHLELKENNRGILKREHLLLPMEDVAKLLGLSLTKISREYQRGCVLGCGWILKGRKRSLRWPSRPLHVLLGHISEKILRETTAMFGNGAQSKSAASAPSKHLALLASASDGVSDESLRSTPLPINCY